MKKSILPENKWEIRKEMQNLDIWNKDKSTI